MHGCSTDSVALGRDIRLKDGTSCRIRALGADDREMVLDCFAGLSPESRRLRFFGVKPVLTESDLAFLTSADGRDHIALAAVRLNDSGQEVEVLGTARCIRLGPGSETCELALAVIDAAQGRGVGAALLARLVEAARRQGIRRLRYEVLAANGGMRALSQRLGSQVRWLDDGALEYVYQIPEPEDRPEESLPFLIDPLATARLAAAWSSGRERVLDGWFVAGKLWLGFWLDPWPVGWSALADALTTEQGLGHRPV